jgi:hypothetical protein|nr:MAG TPA: hypothetical protein [Caudoviricetes sp.]
MCSSIALKAVVMEDFCNYKKPSMFLVTAICDWKCCVEAKIDKSVCQNHGLVTQATKKYTYQSLYKGFISNNITKAIVVGGLEPFLQFDELFGLIKFFRSQRCNATFVIYTGYNHIEIKEQIKQLTTLSNIIIKFGRYIPNDTGYYNNILGIKLASKNQYAEVIC